MRNFIWYILAGALVVLLMDVIAPPVGLSLTVARPSVEGSAPPQVVDRTHKSDRLQIPTASGRRVTPPNTPVLVGCDPVFSSLSTAKQINFPGRCIA